MPPHTPLCEVPASVVAGEGVELHCKDKLSVPPATYRWYKDNKAVTVTADSGYNLDSGKGTLVSEHTHIPRRENTHRKHAETSRNTAI